MAIQKRKAIVLSMAFYLMAIPLMAADYENHWAKEAINKWQTYGIVKGYEDQSFRPNQTITRAEFATILSRVLNLPESDSIPSFIDILQNTDKWYAEDVLKVTSLNLMYIEGMDFLPNQAITREEAAYAIAKAYELSSKAEEIKFTDQEQISNWAVQAIEALIQNNYIKGNPDGSFKPQGTLTRAELVTMLNNVTQCLITQPGTYTESVNGNMLINSKGVTLKNLTIEGDLYLTEGIGNDSIKLENITVKGCIYVKGGQVAMSGTFEEVKLSTGLPLKLEQGNIKKLVINRSGSMVTVNKEAEIAELVENKSVELSGEGKVQGVLLIQPGQSGGAGSAGGGAISGGANGGTEQTNTVEIESAGIYINDKYISLPVSDNVISLDIPSLSQSFKLEDEITGLIIKTDQEGAYLASRFGSMEENKKYTFKQAEKALGIIREAALDAEVNPGVVVNYILGGDKLTIGSLREDFAAAQENASSMGITIESQYEFTRDIKLNDTKVGSFIIEMCIQ